MVVRTPLYVYTVYVLIFGCVSSPLETRDGVVSVDSRAFCFDARVFLSTCAACDASATCGAMDASFDTDLTCTLFFVHFFKRAINPPHSSTR